MIHDLAGNRIAEYDYDSVAGTSVLLREYLWLDGLPLAVVENGTVYHVRWDHIGRPVFATDGLATVVWEASYLSFGGVETSTGSPMELRFPGQWFQSESGLHQNWMRDYDPTAGRYIQADPLGLVDGASVYGYALQNPGRYVDPLGLDAFISISDSAVAGFGHIGISDNPNQTYGHYTRETGKFWNDAKRRVRSCCSMVEGNILPDDMSTVTRMLRISLSAEDTHRLNQCINRRRQEAQPYNVLTNSCADFVRECLAAAGIDVMHQNRPDSLFDRILYNGKGAGLNVTRVER